MNEIKLIVKCWVSQIYLDLNFLSQVTHINISLIVYTEEYILRNLCLLSLNSEIRLTSILFKLQYTIIPLLPLKVAAFNNPTLLCMTHLNLAGIQELDHSNPESFYRAEKYTFRVQFNSVYIYSIPTIQKIYISSSFQPLISPFLLFNAFNSSKLIYHYSISLVGPATC